MQCSSGVFVGAKTLCGTETHCLQDTASLTKHVMQLMDGINEAADTHRYLRRLDEEWAPLYQDISIEKVQTMLPGLLSTVRTMQTVCRWVCLLVLIHLPRILSLISLQAVMSQLLVTDINANFISTLQWQIHGNHNHEAHIDRRGFAWRPGQSTKMQRYVRRCLHSCRFLMTNPSPNISQWRRFYTAPEPLTNFLQSITMQLISSCCARISAPGKIWDQHKPPLISNLCAAVKLRDAYVGSFR